ncbi:MAG: isoprenylcysteine carboxylmethyltransferase family protein [Planctomycetaceae bacterium]|nr:isoprenylcysteine carboxylmethyltransferase family protein [Planctomycetaceae bacterium]
MNFTRLFMAGIIAVLVVSSGYWDAVGSMFSAFLFLAGCVLVGIASIGRLWCSLYIAGYKTKQLIISGPYSICRNPLYFFSLLGGLGAGLTSESLLIPLLIAAAFGLYYPFVIRHEEDKLQALYGSEFESYRNRVPRFWPQLSLLTEPTEYVVMPNVFRRHLFSALWFIWMIGILEIIEELHEMHLLPTYFRIY